MSTLHRPFITINFLELYIDPSGRISASLQVLKKHLRYFEIRSWNILSVGGVECDDEEVQIWWKHKSSKFGYSLFVFTRFSGTWEVSWNGETSGFRTLANVTTAKNFQQFLILDLGISKISDEKTILNQIARLIGRCSRIVRVVLKIDILHHKSDLLVLCSMLRNVAVEELFFKIEHFNEETT